MQKERRAYPRRPRPGHEVVQADLEVLRGLVAGKVEEEDALPAPDPLPHSVQHCQHCREGRDLHSGKQLRLQLQQQKVAACYAVSKCALQSLSALLQHAREARLLKSQWAWQQFSSRTCMVLRACQAADMERGQRDGAHQLQLHSVGTPLLPCFPRVAGENVLLQVPLQTLWARHNEVLTWKDRHNTQWEVACTPRRPGAISERSGLQSSEWLHMQARAVQHA